MFPPPVVLRDEFRVQPSNVEVAVGEVAIMNCSPPLGQPEPNVSWKKNGMLINSTDDHYTVRAIFSTPQTPFSHHWTNETPLKKSEK